MSLVKNSLTTPILPPVDIFKEFSMQEARSKRPTSPHLQIYKWPVTMGTSILHRITGVGLAGGTLVLAWWLVAASMGPDAYGVFETVAFHWFGRLVLFGFTAALVYHALNGVRHLAWDLGYGFKVPTANKTGLITYGATAVLTLIIWIAAYASMGAI
jgi:succinate dehydrogenase / fumarate reductase cytochrome b subunit